MSNIEFMDFLLQLAKESNVAIGTKESQQTEDDMNALKNESNRLYLEAQKKLDDRVNIAKTEGKIEEILDEPQQDQSNLITLPQTSVDLENLIDKKYTGPGFKII